MAKNIGLFINLTLLIFNVKNTIRILSVLPEILMNDWWVDLMVYIVFLILLGLIGAFSIDNIFKIIKYKIPK